MFQTCARLVVGSLILLTFAVPALADSLPDYTPDANATRGEVPDAYKWSLAALYDSPEAWEAEVAELADFDWEDPADYDFAAAGRGGGGARPLLASARRRSA